jgi:hypothetical protein
MTKKDNFKKIGLFLKDLTPVEYRYMEITMQLVSAFQDIIKRHKLSRERFCELFHISDKKYDNYVCGNYTYSVHDMAVLNAVAIQLETERAQQIEVCKIGNVEE